MWRDQNQYDGVKALLSLERDVVISSGTGSGKSLMAIVPTMMEKAHTLLVTPLKSLMDDWERRLQHFGLGYERWNGAEKPHKVGDHNVILVSADMTATDTFKREIALRNVQ
jgi:bloom syndrome protein